MTSSNTKEIGAIRSLLVLSLFAIGLVANSIECRIEVSKRRDYQIQSCLLLLPVGEIEHAKNYLKKVFEIDSTWRLQALDDEDLRPLWDSL